jgi:hypothetical protein
MPNQHIYPDLTSPEMMEQILRIMFPLHAIKAPLIPYRHYNPENISPYISDTLYYNMKPFIEKIKQNIRDYHMCSIKKELFIIFARIASIPEHMTPNSDVMFADLWKDMEASLYTLNNNYTEEAGHEVLLFDHLKGCKTKCLTNLVSAIEALFLEWEQYEDSDLMPIPAMLNAIYKDLHQFRDRNALEELLYILNDTVPKMPNKYNEGLPKYNSDSSGEEL